jgi:hypothetical protein
LDINKLFIEKKMKGEKEEKKEMLKNGRDTNKK